MIELELTDENKKLTASKEYTSSIVNFEKKTIILYQGDEPIDGSEQDRRMIANQGSSKRQVKASFFSKIKNWIKRLLNP